MSPPPADRGLTWYVRRDQDLAGPYPSGTIRRFVLLGRVRVTDEVSRDGQSWQTVQTTSEVMPPAMRDKTGPELEETLQLRRLREDERSGRDRRGPREASALRDQAPPDRRQEEPEEVLRHRIALNERLNQRADAERRQLPWQTVVIVSLIVLAALLFGLWHPNPPTGDIPNCNTPAQPGVNWRNCTKPGVNLSGASLGGADLRNSHLEGAYLAGTDLSHALLGYAWLSQADLSQARLNGANLMGTNLTQADLSYVDLEGADLSFADLRGARLGAAQLTGARLNLTLWIDGRLCAKGSVGTCLLAPLSSSHQ